MTINTFAMAISVAASLILVLGIYFGYVVAEHHYMEKQSEAEENERWQILMAKDWFKEDSEKKEN